MSDRHGMLFEASMSWPERDKLQKLAPEVWLDLKSKLPDDRLPTLQSDRYGGTINREWVCDLAEAQVWSDAGFTLEVSKLRGVVYPVTPADAVRDALRGAQGPTIINVSVSNVGLYDVQTVHYEEDCCTDHLQTLLSHGWRLLAVCPPNDKRRPTYILGHRDADAAGKFHPSRRS
jgi:hypothetical protein